MNSKVGFISGLLGLAALVGALIVVTSRPGNGQEPKTGNIPFQQSFTFAKYGDQQSFQVPSGRTLVIELVNDNTYESTGIQTVAGGNEVSWSILPSTNANFSNVRMYADPGSTVTLTFYGSASGSINISGYLTNKL